MTLQDAHDPTASSASYPAHSAAPTLLSRNEVETLCLKAARGAGMPWGLAEEAGFAAGWLAEGGIDGAAALLAHLQTSAPSAISVQDRHWTAANDAPLCPILLGATLDDHAALAAGPWAAPITLAPTRQPVLMVSFLARAAKACGKPLALTWPGGSMVISASGDLDPAALAALSHVGTTALTLSPSDDPTPRQPSHRLMLPLSAGTLGALNTLALQTTVPASDASRRGAGAASSDND